MDSWWERLWITQLWSLHLHHVRRLQRVRHANRELRRALDWAHAYAEDQRRMRLEAEAREEMAAHVAADIGTDQLEAWLRKRDEGGS